MKMESDLLKPKQRPKLLKIGKYLEDNTNYERNAKLMHTIFRIPTGQRGLLHILEN